MKAMLKNVRLSYVRVFEAAQVNGVGEANYSVCILIPKESETAERLKLAIAEAASEMAIKFPKLKGNLPKVWNNPLRDGDAEKDGAEYQGMYFINAKRKEKQGAPIVIDGMKQYITSKDEMYSGCYGNVAVSLYPYEFTGKYGVGVGLNGIQKTKDGERLDGGTSIDDFDIEGDDNDNIFG